MPALLLPFLGVVAVLTITPGPDMLLVLRNGLRDGSRTAWFTGLGCCTGIATHATAAVLGLSALLAASATAYSLVKLAGAAYLAYLGIRMLIAAFGRTTAEITPPSGTTAVPQAAAAPGEAAPSGTAATSGTAALGGMAASGAASSGGAAGSESGLGLGGAFRQGLFTNLLNPKIALLFLTLLPQFVGSGEPRERTTAMLAVVFLGLAVLWWRVFTLALAPVARWLRRPRVRRTLDALAGSAMIAIGVKVAFEPR